MRAAKTWRGWTRKEELRLEALRAEGATARAIARELGRSEASVKNRLGQLSLPRPRLGPSADPRMPGAVEPIHPRLTALGVRKGGGWSRYLPHVLKPHTVGQVAAALGVTKFAVHSAKRALEEAGFPVWRRRKRKAPANGALRYLHLQTHKEQP